MKGERIAAGCGFILGLLLGVLGAPGTAAQGTLPEAKPVPLMQALPLPHDQVSFQRNGVELARYHYGAALLRPFIYPVNGPSGRSLTRMGHPRDQQSHKHHNSVWISHQSVNGVSFWEDRGAGIIAHQALEKIEDGDQAASLVVYNHWKAGDKILLGERRQITVRSLSRNEWLLIIDMNLEALKEEVILQQTPFGILAVRMAKTIGVHDGGGMIRNSEDGVNEAGTFRKPARWVDYSGPMTPLTVEGITFMDHPANFNHPAVFHTRDDGWMGAALTFNGDRTIASGQSLALRYGLYTHSGVPTKDALEKVHEEFASTKAPNLTQRPK